LLHFNIEKGIDWLERLILEIESMQHGTPSGVDSFISLHGGCVRFQQKGPQKPLEMPQVPLWAVNTGAPESSTGECVSHVSKNWNKSPIWYEFEQVALDVEQALTSKSSSDLGSALSHNQHLLETIGVVPEKVKEFVREIEQQGGSAKLSGAGSIKGQSAGTLLVLSKEPIEELCQKHGYKCFLIEGESSGASVSTL
jgi:mevalonate kinase